MTSTGIYKVNELLHDALKAEGFVTVTFGTESEKDLNKQDMFPYAHMTLTTREISSNIDVITYEIAILDVVDEGNKDTRKSLNQFGLTNNIEDVFHDLGYKFNRAYQTFRKDTANIVEVPDTLTLTPGYAEVQNKLAGYLITLAITIPNTGTC